MIELRKIDHNNWLRCIALEVGEEQRQYVNPNLFSLAEAYVHSDANKEDAETYYRCIPFALYHKDEMIGFALITYEKEHDFDGKPAYELYRLMIDKKHQGHGYGREAIQILLAYIKTFPYGEAKCVYAEWHPENKASERLCTASGFLIVGTEDDGAVKARLELND